MIDVKQAVAFAIEYARELYPEAESGSLMLEEVELSADENYWLVTLSFTRRNRSSSPLMTLTNELERVYKIFQIKSDSGQVVSMKIRKI